MGGTVRGPTSHVTDEELVEMHLSGMTLTEVGNEVGLTRERVRQRVRRAGVSPEETRAVLEDSRPDDVEWECEECGGTVATRPYEVGRFCSIKCRSEARRRYTDEEMLDALRELGKRVGRTPTADDVNSSSDVPTCTLYQNRFGSLRRAQGLAGLEANPVGTPVRKLDATMVREIRRRARAGEKQVDLAREYGVSGASIGRAINRRTWKHV